jgi:hypothetical protein
MTRVVLALLVPLDRVVLDRDTQGRETPFTRNRDKFLRALAATDPNTFLYNFRDAFGQPQPEGTRPLEGWDSQTTRLRGHASGHYLTAIAQAYASTGADPELQATFRQKMEVDVLHDLSQKSGRPAQPGGAFVSDPAAVPVGPGRDGYDSNLRTWAVRNDYWNWGTGFISAYPPDQFIMLERGATYGRRTARSGRRTTRCTRSSRGSSMCTRSPATRRRSRSSAAWAPGSTLVCKRCLRRRAARCGAVTSRASTGA